ncbi:hypothetical protein GMJLKIPL_4798 [Methylobacterium isbiliense]|uniref:Uncharacterized protein n=1 Tax=Methylobacterium isbiliense TaxID=315478 RepID=A0ABQ4SI39_9HYPH|nr:hypothetical protein GMJLKIPL_4798 [Methylobacterium isbiliense]
MAAQLGREHPRRHGGHHAVEPGHAGAEGDQREHVEVAALHRRPAAFEERPAGPQHHRRGQHQLQPVAVLLAEAINQASQVTAHFQREHRQRQHQADPEPPGHVDQLGARAGVGADQQRLQCHAADRAGSGTDLANFGVHRAGIDRALGHGFGLRSGTGRVEVARRVGRELRLAAGRAEVVGAPVVLGAMLGRVRVDRHPADRVLDGPLGRRAGVVMRMMMVMTVRSVVVGCRHRLAMLPAAAVTMFGRRRSLIGGRRLARSTAAAGGVGSLILRAVVGVVGHGGVLS